MAQILVFLLYLICECIKIALSANHTNIVVGVMLNAVGLHPLDKYHFKPAIDIAFETVNQGVQDGTYLNFTLSYIFR